MVAKRIKPKGLSTEEMIAGFENGEGVSDKSRKILDSITEKQAEKQSDVHNEDPIFNSGAVSDLVMLAHVQPQPDNSRYLPVKIATDNDEYSLSELTDCVVCEKGILENRLDPSNVRYDDVEKEIEKVRELAEQLRYNDLINPIVVWRGNTSSYPIVTGHRRYYALRFLYGPIIKVKAKIYQRKPKNVNLLRHVENEVRNDLSPADRLRSFILAKADIQEELDAIASKTERAIHGSKLMGTNQAWYYRNVALETYKDEVLEILDRKIYRGIESLSDEVRAASKSGSESVVRDFLKAILALGKAINFNNYMESIGTNASEEGENEGSKQEAKKVGPKKRTIAFPRMKVKDSTAIIRLLKEDVTKLDTGVDWEKLDTDDAQQVEEAVKSVIKALTKKK